MRQVVKDAFFDYTAKREGFTPHMYCDKLNLVTTGVGNLIDHGPRNGLDISPAAMAPAMSLPWFHKQGGWTAKNPIVDNVRASQSEIANNWKLVKLAGRSQMGGFAGYENLAGNDLSLSMSGVMKLYNDTLDRMDTTLTAKYRGFQDWPADAQLATLSMAWAMGPNFDFPAFKAAVERMDFESAAKQSFFKGGGGTLEHREGRNADNVIMFSNADVAVKGGIDFDRLFFPGTSNSAGRVSGGGIASIAGANPRIGSVAMIGGAAALSGWAGWELFKHWKGKR